MSRQCMLGECTELSEEMVHVGRSVIRKMERIQQLPDKFMPWPEEEWGWILMESTPSMPIPCAPPASPGFRSPVSYTSGPNVAFYLFHLRKSHKCNFSPSRGTSLIQSPYPGNQGPSTWWPHLIFKSYFSPFLPTCPHHCQLLLLKLSALWHCCSLTWALSSAWKVSPMLSNPESSSRRLCFGPEMCSISQVPFPPTKSYLSFLTTPSSINNSSVIPFRTSSSMDFVILRFITNICIYIWSEPKNPLEFPKGWKHQRCLLLC